MTGIEPANDGITTHCRNHLATPTVIIILSFFFRFKILSFEFNKHCIKIYYRFLNPY